MPPALADASLSFLTTLFCFLLVCNLLGLVPLLELAEALGLGGWGGVDAQGLPRFHTPLGGAPTSGVWVCAAFAAMTLILVIMSSYLRQVLLLWKGRPAGEHHGHHVPPCGANVWMGLARLLESASGPCPWRRRRPSGRG